MGMAAGCVKLERGFEHGPARAQLIGELGRVGVGGHARAHALRAFKNLLGTREALAGQERGGQSVTCGFRSVKLLGIGGVAQKFP